MPIIHVTPRQLERLRRAVDELDPDQEWSSADYAIGSIEKRIADAITREDERMSIEIKTRHLLVTLPDCDGESADLIAQEIEDSLNMPAAGWVECGGADASHSLLTPEEVEEVAASFEEVDLAAKRDSNDDEIAALRQHADMLHQMLSLRVDNVPSGERWGWWA